MVTSFKRPIIFLFALLLCGCNFLGETEHDSDFVFSVPQDDLLVWLDASNYSKLSLTGTDVYFWYDYESTAQEFACSPYPTLVEDGLAGNNVIDFSTAGYCTTTRTSDGTTNYTFFAVVDPTTTGMILADITNNNISFEVTPGVGTFSYTYAAGGTTISYADTSKVGTFPMLFTVVLNDPYGDIYINGEWVYDGTFTAQELTSSSIQVGQAAALGSIGEVLLYQRALSKSEQEFIENYLMEKWEL